MPLFNLLSLRLHVAFVLTELSKGVNISGLIGEDTQRPSSWHQKAGYLGQELHFMSPQPPGQLPLGISIYFFRHT